MENMTNSGALRHATPRSGDSRRRPIQAERALGISAAMPARQHRQACLPRGLAPALPGGRVACAGPGPGRPRAARASPDRSGSRGRPSDSMQRRGWSSAPRWAGRQTVFRECPRRLSESFFGFGPFDDRCCQLPEQVCPVPIETLPTPGLGCSAQILDAAKSHLHKSRPPTNYLISIIYPKTPINRWGKYCICGVTEKIVEGIPICSYLPTQEWTPVRNKLFVVSIRYLTRYE